MKHYDYIFTGAGLSALMVVHQMLQSGKFTDKAILLLDQNLKNSNDRTWCFWEKNDGPFDSIVSKSWKQAIFATGKFRRKLDFAPYEYKMIRGIDFYDFVLGEISISGNINLINDAVTEVTEMGSHCIVSTTTESFSCNKVFNSIFDTLLLLGQQKYPVLQQHFIGWFIKSETAAFNPGEATFMDFSIPQQGNTRFMYVLPFSTTEALVEYTLFSKELLPKEEYESAISTYLNDLGILKYAIVDKESGSIPMTSYKFWEHNSSHILHIGTAGGWTKGSTGFTFRNTLKNSHKLIAFLQDNGDLAKFHKTSRFWFYDLLLLDILNTNNQKGKEVFASLFSNGDSALIFKFLDEETTLAEDLRVILKCPKRLFFNAMLSRLFK